MKNESLNRTTSAMAVVAIAGLLGVGPVGAMRPGWGRMMPIMSFGGVGVIACWRHGWPGPAGGPVSE